MQRWLTALAITVGTSSCGGRSTPPAPAPAPSGAGAAEAAAWRSWVKVNDTRFASEGHVGAWVDVHVDAPFVEAYRRGTVPAPVGMRVVKAGYPDPAGRQPEALTVMTKMPPGYDADHGDWHYAVLDEDGVTARMQGRLSTCIECHDQVEDRDYLFGPPRD